MLDCAKVLVCFLLRCNQFDMQGFGPNICDARWGADLPVPVLLFGAEARRNPYVPIVEFPGL